MGNHFSGQVGTRHYHTGVCDRIHIPSALPSHGQADSPPSPRGEEAGTSERGIGIIGEEGYIPGLPSLQGGLLVDLLSGAKEDRGLEAYLELEAAKQACQAFKVQDGNTGLRPPVPYQGHVGGLYRSEGRLPPYSDTRERPAMALFHGTQPIVPVQMPAFWTVDRPPGLYPGGQSCSGVPETQGYQPMRLPGRLAGVRTFQGGTDTLPGAGYSGGTPPGVSGQCSEIELDTNPETPISGGGTRPHERDRGTVPGEDRQAGICSQVPEPTKSGPCALMATGPRLHGQHGGFSPLLSVSHETDTNPPAGLLQAQRRSSCQTSSSEQFRAATPDVVGIHSQPVSRSEVSITPSEACHNDRRFVDRLGRTPERPGDLGSMDSIGSPTPHQPSRTLGGATCSPAVRGHCCGRKGLDPIRQFHGSCVSEQGRGYPFLPSVCPHAQVPDMVSGTQHCDPCGSHSGYHKRASGRSLSRDVQCTHGMHASTSYSSDHLPNVVLSQHRPIRNSPQQTTSGILLPVLRDGSVCCRCSVHRLDGNGGLRLPPAVHSEPSGEEDSAGTVQSDPHSTVLATTSMVSSIGGPNRRRSHRSSHTTRSPKRSGKTKIQSNNPESEVDCVAIIRRRYRKDGFSERTAEILSAGRRDSTLRVYNQRLGSFFRWCRARGISPTRAPTTEVAEFLTEKFDSGLEASTIRNYKSAILAVHRGCSDGSSLDDDGSLKQLLTGMFNVRPSPRPQLPAWELSGVLQYLSGSPFEPLRDATLKSLSYKTVMLVALASGKRCSEIHALSLSATKFSDTGVSLFFRPDFIAKNESSTFRHSSLFIPKIGMHSSVPEDRVWCPVRALREYLRKTAHLRGDHDNIFLTFVEPHRPAAKVTLARWLVSVLVDSGAVDAGSNPRAHSTRAVGSSWAFHKGLSVASICDSVCWKSQSTFSSVYYRNVDGGPKAQYAKKILSKTKASSTRTRKTNLRK